MMVYPARSHAGRSLETFSKLYSTEGTPAIVLAAAKTIYFPDCDQTVPLRQDRYFSYFTGAFDLPDAFVTFVEGKLTLYLPPVDEEDVMWSGLPLSPEEAKAKYDVDQVKYSTDIEKDLSTSSDVRTIPSHADYCPYAKSCTHLQEAIDETRAIKDKFEIELMRKANQISDKSHLAVMSALPIEQSEGHIHAEFVYHCMRQGAKGQAYDPICGSGSNCGTLHYVRNDEELEGKLLVLIDAGAEWQNYASDVTRVFPINGKWTPECRQIYDLVLKMQTECMAMVKPGAKWEDLHLHSHKVLVRGLIDLGILHNGSEDDIFKSGISTAFYPHGLGHMIGLNTHDTAGHANYEDENLMLRYLRIRRTLQEGNVVTVEPGCYFNKFLLEPHLSVAEVSKYINHSVLERYWSVGGVRIEDDVVVLADGYENLTGITSDADEVAKIVTEGLSKGRKGFHCVV